MLAAKTPDVEVMGDAWCRFKDQGFAPYVAKIRASGADSVLTGTGAAIDAAHQASNEWA